MKLPTFGLVRDCKIIGAHPDHLAVRERTEQRIAALKQHGVLIESQRRSVPALVTSASNEASIGEEGVLGEVTYSGPAIVAAKFRKLTKADKQALDRHLQLQHMLFPKGA